MDYNDALNSLSYNPLFNLGMGLMASSGPSLTPHSFGQDLAAGTQYMQTAQQRAMQVQMLRYQMQQ